MLLVGCGETAGVAPEASPSGGDEPVTARSLAWVAAEHTGAPSSAEESTDVEELGRDAVGAELRFGSDGEYDGDMLVVGVGSGVQKGLFDCDSPMNAELTGCVELEDGLLLWEGHAPEEDPGVVYVAVPKGDSQVVLFYAGPDITKDPRELDMPISVEDLFAIAHDDRVNLTTSQEAIDGGESLSFWKS
jgi:hypothetical protein